MIGSDSPIPFVKPDPDEQHFANSMNGYTNGGRQGLWLGSQNFDNFNHMSSSSSGSMLLKPTFGSQQNLTSSFNDEELADLIDFEPDNIHVQSPQRHFNTNGTNNSQSQPMFNGLRNMSAPQQHIAQHSFANQSPIDSHRQNAFPQTFDQSNFQYTGHRQEMANQYQSMSRLSTGSGSLGDGSRIVSNSLSPITSNNPNLAHLQLGTSDSSSTGMHPIPNRTHRSASSTTHWEGGFSMTGSPSVDTPLTSPMSGPPLQRQLSSIMENGKNLPPRSKHVPHKSQSVPSTGMSKEEQKKAKRRFAHNVVEQKRRDKINERIQELSSLVPIHRLEDNKRTKQLATNARNSGTNGMSPTSSSLRRSTSISQGTTIDERDKTKGNSLDSAVTWTRDLMWLLQRMVEQESLLIETIESMGGQVPFEVRDDEARMRSELMLALKQDGDVGFDYSRHHGSGLYVPDYTDQSGNKLSANGESDPDFTTGFQSPGAQEYNASDNQMWDYAPHSGRDSLDYAEADDFNLESMEMS